jgi:predicted flap endonuclease-1-like 5' DNA nuclease
MVSAANDPAMAGPSGRRVPLPPAGDRLREALAARAARQSDLMSLRAERLARIRTRSTPDGPLTLLAAGAPAAAANPPVRPPADPPIEPLIDLAADPLADLPPDPWSEASAGVPAEGPLTAASLCDAEALERLLIRLAGALEPPPAPAPAAPVVPLPRPARSAPAAVLDTGGLATLPGVGPGLVAMLVRAGVTDLTDVAALGPAGLAARLGPLARLIDLAAWSAYAAAATAD